MKGSDDLEINLNNLNEKALVCDIVYKPLMTNLLKNAEKQGNPITTGIGMLIYQGLFGFEKWFGEKPEIEQNLINEMIELSIK
jgi:shikimate dehydrogenase